MPERTACNQHGAARQADCADHGTHAIGIIKGEAARRQSIQVRRPNLGITERSNRIRAMVVGENEKDVRSRVSSAIPVVSRQ